MDFSTLDIRVLEDDVSKYIFHVYNNEELSNLIEMKSWMKVKFIEKRKNILFL